MNTNQIVNEIDGEIERLSKVRSLLAGSSFTETKSPGRPKLVKGHAGQAITAMRTRSMSPEARQKIAAAQKKRWAVYHKMKKAA